MTFPPLFPPVRPLAPGGLSAEEIDHIEHQAAALNADDRLIPLSQVHELARTAQLLIELLDRDGDWGGCTGCIVADQLGPLWTSSPCPYHLGVAHDWEAARAIIGTALKAPEHQAAREAVVKALEAEEG
ncbi:hypothetical protein GCM10009678_79120 [Actinomadura kijaniata]|uniref:Uncharacterized protein n=1 Tax=Actinomadura namibiensis TaxID=182080 RepID=A0A7W3LYY7_ACTNM|nr:hypothetical protein [Actinomadura namibiensis]MBA8956911.1 hypothetical protein [Actinomadura namibiensis]